MKFLTALNKDHVCLGEYKKYDFGIAVSKRAYHFHSGMTFTKRIVGWMFNIPLKDAKYPALYESVF
jgi:hypothetical protein